MIKKIRYVDLPAQWRDERNDLLPIIEQVLEDGLHVGGSQVDRFEDSARAFFGLKHVVSLNSGTDALICALAAVGIKRGDEVITPPNSFIASTAAITHLGAKPVFVDVKADQNIDHALIEGAITPNTRAIMPVHLTGRMASMSEINAIAEKYRLAVIEDAAQAAGSRLKGRLSGTWGHIGCFSAHPLKNLNACGDAGFIVTDDDEVAAKVRSMRNHGLVDRNTVEKFGFVSRMDSIQAAILNYRLLRLDSVIEKRRQNVSQYIATLDPNHVFHPPEESQQFNSWHTFVIQVDDRDRLQQHLAVKGIETAIHYPIPIHLQPAAQSLAIKATGFPVAESQAKRILTLPIHQFLTNEEIDYVAASVNEFFA